MLLKLHELLSNGVWLPALMIVLPALMGVFAWTFRKNYVLLCVVSAVYSVFELLAALAIYFGSGIEYTLAFAGNGLEMHLVTDEVCSMFLLTAAVMFALLSMYSLSSLRNKPWRGVYMMLLFVSIAMINGALMSYNLGIMLFFWEGLLCTLFAMLLIRNSESPKTAVKALSISGTADLLLMLGIIITAWIAGTSDIGRINRIPVEGWGAVGCACMLLGALGKAGCMPFHSWIPNAASDAPTPFLAAFPGSLEKVAGIYLTVRIVGQLYDIQPGSPMSISIMLLGAVTLFFGVGVALIQKDMKKLLSYHAISQVGYMVLGIGSALPIGIAGGVFHMLNNAVYKSGLFMIAGAIEDSIGTTDLKKFGGLRRKMPMLAVCFVVFALSIAGFPGTNGFFSKELIFDAALETNTVFYIIALLGAFMTAASFLKMGRSAFFGKEKLPQSDATVKRSRFGVLLPVLILALLSLAMGVFNSLPLDSFIGRSLSISGSFSGWPELGVLVAISCAVLAAAVLDHIYGSRRDGCALAAVDHIHYAPGFKTFYAWVERGIFDPYNRMMDVVNGFSWVCTRIERGVSWIYDTGIPKVVEGAGNLFSRLDNGSIARYIVLVLIGVGAVGAFLLYGLLWR